MQFTGHATREFFDRYNITDTGDLEDAAQRLHAYAAAQPKAARKVASLR